MAIEEVGLKDSIIFNHFQAFENHLVQSLNFSDAVMLICLSLRSSLSTFIFCIFVIIGDMNLYIRCILSSLNDQINHINVISMKHYRYYCRIVFKSYLNRTLCSITE